MADVLKTAGLRLRIDGAAEFQRSLTSINSALKTSNTELSKVQAIYGKTGTSVEGLTAKKAALAKKLETVREKTATLKAVLAEAEEKYGANSKEAERLRAEIGQLEVQELKLNNQVESLAAQIAVQSSAWTKLGTKLEAVSTKLIAVGKKMTSVGKTMSLAITAPLVAAGTAAAKTAIDFESAFTGVAKTVDASDEELARLSRDIRNLAKEIPATTTEIAAVAEAAGQLGIATEDIMDFTKVMIALGESTNLSADEAATALAKFANITGMAADDYDRLGSVIVGLGNNFATTEADIVQMSTRLASAGTLAGLSETEIMALAAAMSSVGIEAEAGGTAMTQTMTAIEKAVAEAGDDLGEFARIAGMSSGDFAAAWENKPIEAISAFVKGLGELDAKGESATLVLDELGLSGVRQSNMLKSLALASGVLTDAVNLSSEAWDENTALSNEAEKRYGTMESRLKTVKNTLSDVAITFGEILMPYIEKGVEKLRQFADWLGSLDEAQQKQIVKLGAIAAAIGPVLTILGKATSGIGSIVSVAGKASAAIGKAGGLAGALAKLKPALTALTGPVGIVIAAVAVLTAAFVNLWKNNEEFREKMTAIWEGIKVKFQEFAQGITDRLNELGFDFQSITDVLKAIWDGFCNLLAPVFEAVWQQISNVLSVVLDVITGILDVFIGIFTGDWERAWEGVKEVFVGIWNFIKSTFENIVNLLKGLADVFLGWFGTSWDEAWTAIKEFFVNTWNSIKDFFTSVLNSIKTFFQTIWNAISTFFTNTVNGIKNTATNVWNAIKTFFTTTLNSIKTTFSNIWSSIATAVSNTWDNIKTSITNKFKAVKDTISNIGESIKNIFSGILSNVWNWGANLIQGFIDGIKSKIQAVKDAVSNVVSAVGDFLGFNSPAKEGDGRHIIEWGENMIGGFLEGVSNMQDAVRDVVGGITATAAVATASNAPVDSRSYTYGGITVESLVVREEADIKKIAKELYGLQTRSSRGMGVKA